jgi:hypothetical protein
MHNPAYRVFLVVLAIALLAAACGPRPEREGEAGDSTPGEGEVAIVAFEPVAAILEATCATAACHAASRGAGQLVLSPDQARESLVDAPSNQQDGATLVIPGDPDGSYLMAKLRGEDGIRGARMPIGQSPLSDEEMATIADWIAGGAGE